MSFVKAIFSLSNLDQKFLKRSTSLAKNPKSFLKRYDNYLLSSEGILGEKLVYKIVYSSAHICVERRFIFSAKYLKIYLKERD